MPRFVPATVSELSRVSLLASVPGEELMKIAGGWSARRSRPAGRSSARAIRASGSTSSSRGSSPSAGGLGPRRVLQPGDYFGEVALAMDIPRTASVRALTPAVVASCDRETFDELLRPLFAED